jgi:molecular chaperone DnaJ
MKRTYYDILQIPFGTTGENIKKARNRLAIQYHPDKVSTNRTEATQRFHEINIAYSVLSNSKKTVIYNAIISKPVKASFTETILQNVTASGLFSLIEIGNIQTALTAREIEEHKKKAKVVLNSHDLDVHIDTEITLEDAYFGRSQELAVSRLKHCSACNGSGSKDSQSFYECPDCLSLGFQWDSKVPGIPCKTCTGAGLIVHSPCSSCHGKGHHQERTLIKFTIPKGADTGTVVKISAEGDQMPNKAGNLFVRLIVRKHPLFEREGHHLRLSWPISPVVLMEGGGLEVPSLKGPLKITLKRGQGPQMVTLKGAGMPYRQSRNLLLGHMVIDLQPDYSGRLVSKQKRGMISFMKGLDIAASKGSRITQFFHKFILNK